MKTFPHVPGYKGDGLVLMELWDRFGGSWHGPRVETVTMPLNKFGEFIAEIAGLVPSEPLNEVLANFESWSSRPAELTRIIRSPEVRERLVSQGAEVYTMSPTEFSAFFDRERKNWAGVVAEGGVKID